MAITFFFFLGLFFLVCISIAESSLCTHTKNQKSLCAGVKSARYKLLSFPPRLIPFKSHQVKEGTRHRCGVLQSTLILRLTDQRLAVNVPLYLPPSLKRRNGGFDSQAKQFHVLSGETCRHGYFSCSHIPGPCVHFRSSGAVGFELVSYFSMTFYVGW